MFFQVCRPATGTESTTAAASRRVQKARPANGCIGMAASNPEARVPPRAQERVAVDQQEEPPAARDIARLCRTEAQVAPAADSILQECGRDGIRATSVDALSTTQTSCGRPARSAVSASRQRKRRLPRVVATTWRKP